jgi:sarcosine oxidase subunit beta
METNVLSHDNKTIKARWNQLKKIAETKWDYIIIGGGIAGLSLAEALTRRSNASVLILEAKLAGSGASTRNVGRLTHAGCTSHIKAKLAIETRKTLNNLQAQLKHNFILQSLGEVTVLYNESEFHQIESVVLPFMRGVGLQGNLINREDIETYIPGYNTHGAVGAFVTSETFVVHPDALLMWFIQALRKRKIPVIEYAKVNNLIRNGNSICGVVSDECVIEADQVVLCCGTEGKDFLAEVGWFTPLEIRRQQTVVIENIRDPGWPVIRWTGPVSSGSCHRTARGEVLAACQHPEGDIVNNNQTTLEFMLRTADQLYHHLPLLRRAAILRQWGGVTSYAPDGLPYAGPVPERPGLWVLFGINGFTIYPLLADYLSSVLLDIAQDTIMAHFSLSTKRGIRTIV